MNIDWSRSQANKDWFKEAWAYAYQWRYDTLDAWRKKRAQPTESSIYDLIW
jgi:hypothetical protein